MYKHTRFPSFIVNFSDCKGEFSVCFYNGSYFINFYGRKSTNFSFSFNILTQIHTEYLNIYGTEIYLQNDKWAQVHQDLYSGACFFKLIWTFIFQCHRSDLCSHHRLMTCDNLPERTSLIRTPHPASGSPSRKVCIYLHMYCKCRHVLPCTWCDRKLIAANVARTGLSVM